jgi:hypothetical protein
MSKRGRRRHAKGPAFVQLYWHLLDSRAWHLLSLGARAAYLEVARLYDGTNNGRLGMSARRLAGLLPCNKDTAGRRLRELEHAGFLELVKIGSFNRRAIERKASEYRLTCFRCDITGDPPSRKFDPNVRWEIERPKPSDANVCPFRTFNAENRPNVRRNRTLKPSERPTKPDTNVRRNNTHIDLPPLGDTARRTDTTLNPTPLPRGWTWQRVDKGVIRPVTPKGVVVPLVDNPLSGTDAERAAFRALHRWHKRQRGNGQQNQANERIET